VGAMMAEVPCRSSCACAQHAISSSDCAQVREFLASKDQSLRISMPNQFRAQLKVLELTAELKLVTPWLGASSSPALMYFV